jgi:tRNA nucleotidyltransferase (CCA-adding enzyme)
MPHAGAVYPQVEPGVSALMRSAIAIGRPGVTVVRALELCRDVDSGAIALGPRRIALAADLARALEWGFGGSRAADVAASGLAALDARAPEIAARRLLIAGAQLIVVRRGRQPVGYIDRDTAGIALPGSSVRHQLDRADTPDADLRRWLLHAAGELGESMGVPVWAAGGLVRDLLLGRAAPDVDLVVEGDGIAFARRLAGQIGGAVTTHAEFGTASIDGGTGPGARALGRIDVASARTERYDAPGALPVVMPAAIGEDLGRRDFSINAMAVALAPRVFGELLDPFGGRRDLRDRVLRPLSPLSFVEDPTRMFRAARYGARLGFRLAAQGRAALRLALGAEYRALSGQRLRAEIELIAAEPRCRAALQRVLSWGLLGLVDRGYRRSPRTGARLRAAGALRAWADSAGVALDPGEVALIALLLDQERRVARRCLERLAIRGERRAALESALASRSLSRTLGLPALRPSAVADALRGLPVPVLAAVWLAGRRRCRRRVEWFLGDGRSARPFLSGDEVASLGVPRGPSIGECLAALRRLRLDGVVRSAAEERAYVARWTEARAGASGATGTAGRDRKEA